MNLPLRFLIFTIALTMAGTLAASSVKPNIVFVMADDLGYHSLGAFGQKMIKTPHLDKLAEQGMTFTQFYANQLCSPARGSLMTGLHAGHGLIRGNYELGGYQDAEEFGQMPLPANIQTLGTELKRAGYATAVMGKWGIGGPNSTGMPHLHGIDLFYGYLDQKQAHNYYPTHLWRNDVRVDLPNRPFSVHPQGIKISDPSNPASYSAFTGQLFSGDVIQSNAMQFIRDNQARPFFLEMAYTLPHMALQVPPRVLERYQGKFDDKPYLGERGYVPNQHPRATYAAMISLLDDYVGELLQVLKQTGLEHNTLVVFTADNGAAVVGGGDADYFNCSGALRGRKGSLYEGGIKVPFIAWWPGVIKAGAASDHLSAIWDLMPTFLDAAGTAASRPVDGLSFLPALTGRGTCKEHEFLYWERHGKNGENHTQAVRFGDWKAVKTSKTNGVELALYNLKQDPSEKRDVASAHPELVRQSESFLGTRRLGIIAEWNFAKPGEEE